MRRLLALTCAALLGAPSLALADGDPASDVLLGQNVYYPYSPPVSRGLQTQLNALTQNARVSGFPVRVALIQSPVDLGVIPDLFGKPQKYADFLDQEISFQTKQVLLVVMPAGYGTQGMPARAAAAAATLPKPNGKSSDALASAAIAAIPKLAQAAGHPIKSAAHENGGKGSSSVLLVILVAAAAIVAGALALVTLRRRAPAKR
jgi:hypothetical protein